MAALTRILSLNLGSQTVGLAEFRTLPNGGLVLQGFRLREIVADVAGEGIRYAQVQPALREMLDEPQIKSGRVNYGVAGQSVFARRVQLALEAEERIDRIISFEAERHALFPIALVVCVYQ